MDLPRKQLKYSSDISCAFAVAVASDSVIWTKLSGAPVTFTPCEECCIENTKTNIKIMRNINSCKNGLYCLLQEAQEMLNFAQYTKTNTNLDLSFSQDSPEIIISEDKRGRR